MNKNTQILLGVGILGIGGYLYWKSTQKPKNMVGAIGGKRKNMIRRADGFFANADGIFANASGEKIFANGDGTAKPLPRNNFDIQGSGWLRGADGTKIFKNMAQPMTTQNCGHTGSWNC